MANTEIKLVPIEQVHLNEQNPRLIKDHRFEALKKSIQDFPEMLTTRPLVVDENFVVLGGNMRLQALLQLKHTDVPIIMVTGWTEDQKRQFVIKDNASFGEWDWDELANNWSDLPLSDWIDVPKDWITTHDTDDYSDRNKEVDLADFEEKMEFKLKLNSDQFFDLQERLSVVKAKQGVATNEEAIFELLAFYESHA